MKTIAIILIALCTAASAVAAPPEIKIYLPRTLQVQSCALTLGDICVIRCEDEKLLARAMAVTMGRGPFFGESLSLGRQAILGRMGSSGIDIEGVLFTGAASVTLESKDQALASDQLVRAAQSFLQENQPLSADRVWQVVRPPSAVGVKDIADVQLKTRLSKQPAPPNHVRVEVVLCAGQKEQSTVEVFFRADYLVQEAVATEDIPARSRLRAEQFTVRLKVMQIKPSQEWVSPLAMEAVQAIPKGTVIGPSSVKLPRLEVIVRRNQKVSMRIEGLGFRISGAGQAMEDGKAGDVIRVLNVDSKQAVACKVAADGSVHPLYDEEKK